MTDQVKHRHKTDYPQADNIYHLLQTQAERRPDAIAIAAPGRAPLTYGALRIQVDYIANMLHALGVGRNDRVAIVLPNGPEMAVTFIGVAASATSAPLNPAYRAGEFDFYLSDLNARALIVQADMDSPARAVAQAHHIPVIELSPRLEAEAGVFTLTGEARSHAMRPGFAQSHDIALVLHTSGTTSRPKLVPLTQTNLCTSARNMCISCELTDQDRCLNVMPLFHAHGLMSSLSSSLVAGTSIVCTSGFDPSAFLTWLEAYRPTWYTAVPTIHQAILAQVAHNREYAASLPPLHFVRSASASLAPQVMADLESVFKAPVIEAYGMTEACSQIASNPLPPRERKVNSVGVATGCDVAIMDAAGNLLTSGNTGEIVIRGPNVTLGYENPAVANESALPQGWLRTGDQGVLDTDGYLFITGRIKEMINRGGRTIAPRQVDDVLTSHPDIAQAVAFARPHATLGEDIVAAVVLRRNASITERDIRHFALQHLADYKVPSQVVMVDEIPKSATGKIQRIGLYTQLASKMKVDFAAPGNPLEHSLAGIWAGVLNVAQVGVNDNFFDLGGNSLHIADVHRQLTETFGQDLSVTDLFEHSTISSLANYLRDKESEPLSLPQPDQQVSKFKQGKNRLQQQLRQRQRSAKD